ncbi:MAG: hypothetical protein CHKLHMKO_00409 [Candidatus Argoarchaeum ethanivorans]|uniref:HNH domain-containing protein n=1 Tax=Candidatus Argoarchaeum ethanivorans TaxID=2608793 RepID=A0A811T9S4_9EURY|nr:MAG: hypothetical protein CHKLHMKO_00409 [Candidatus Argoarchaeum ethanivorans]
MGGKDDIDNFVLLCSNCHTLVHSYSSKRYRDKEIRQYLNPELTDEAIEKLKSLAGKIQNVKREVEENENLWNIKTPYTLDDAITIISHRNKFTEYQKKLLLETLSLVLENIPKPIVQRCSYRLLKNGKYMSINLMNYLLFRTPAYGDFGEMPVFDCYFTFPKNKIPSNLKPIEGRDVFNFRYFDCINLGLSYTEILKFTKEEWSLFKEACEMANDARKTRNWISNIDINAKDENVA